MTRIEDIPTKELEEYLAIAQINDQQLRAYIRMVAKELRSRLDGRPT